MREPRLDGWIANRDEGTEVGRTEATTKEEQQQNAVQDSESQSWSTSDAQVAGLARTRTDNRRCTHVATPQSR